MKEAIGVVMAKLNEGLDPNVALDNLPDAKRIADLMEGPWIATYLELLLKRGLDPNYLVRRMSFIAKCNLAQLEQAGVSRELLVSELFRREEPYVITGFLKRLFLRGYGELMDIRGLLLRMSSAGIFLELELWLWIGVNSELLLGRLNSREIAEAIPKLVDAGVTVAEIVRALEPYERIVNFDQLIRLGAEMDPNRELDRVSGEIGSVSEQDVLALLFAGAKPMKLAQILTRKKLLEVLPILISFGLDQEATPTQLFTPEELVENARYLSDTGFGVSYERLLNYVSEAVVAAHFSELLDVGFEVSELLPRTNQTALNSYIQDIAGDEKLEASEKALILPHFSAPAVMRNLEFLENHGFKVDVKALARDLNYSEREAHLEELYSRGVKLDYAEMVKGFDHFQVASHLPLLLEAGVQPDFLVNRACSWGIKRNLELLLDAGANPNIIAFALNDDDLLDVKEVLLARGATMWLT